MNLFKELWGEIPLWYKIMTAIGWILGIAISFGVLFLLALGCFALIKYLVG